MKFYKSSWRIKTILILSLIIVVSAPFAYSYYQQKEIEGICWGDMRKLSDDELYQRAMLYKTQRMLQIQNEIPNDWKYCKYAENCKVWMIQEPLNIKQIKQKMETLWGQNMLSIMEAFKMKALDPIALEGTAKQLNNSFTLVENIHLGSSVFYPSDCCSILSLAEVKEIIHLNNLLGGEDRKNLSYIKPEKESLNTKYIRMYEYWSNIKDSSTLSGNGLEGVTNFEQLQSMEGLHVRYLRLNNCGEIQHYNSEKD